jgi:uncharacterized repeat protein (TIGR02543 family)
MIRTSNEYRVTFANNNEISVIAQDTIKVATQNESVDNPVAQITRLRTGIQQILEDPVVNVAFQTQVTPAGAVTAGCQATPSSFTVAEGTPVIFEALPGAGYAFAGWYKDGVALSTDATVSLNVSAPRVGQDTTIYEARFTPSP